MEIKNEVFQDVQIAFRNLSGKPGKYNNEGDRNFCILLESPKKVEDLEQKGWSISYLKPKDPRDPPQPMLRVAVSYKKYPPKVIIVNRGGKTLLPESDIHIVDWAEIESVDVVVRPYPWTVNGHSGIKAYLKTMYVKLVEDELEDKYKAVPDSAASTIGGCGNCEVCDGHCDPENEELPF